MTPLECERIFERIEEYKRSIEKYIQDVASLVEKVAVIVDVEEDPWMELEPDEGLDLDEGVDLDEGELEMEMGADEVINNEDLVDFLIETFDLNF